MESEGWNDERLDQSELSLIERTIVFVGKDLSNPTVFEHYKLAYLRMRGRMNLPEWQPAADRKLQ
jgi:hypothetical protein